MKDSDINITDVESLMEAVKFAYDQFSGQVWWRGQQCENWSLIPSVYRRDIEDDYYESGICVRFQQKAYVRHSNVPPINEFGRWLFLMQHYRLPTRLLDWTESPLIGCFFSSEDNNKQEPRNGALFALSPYKLNKDQIDLDKLLLPEHAPCSELINSAFGNKNIDKDIVVAIRPYEEDIRMMVQQSVFTIHGKGQSIDKLNNHEDFILKFIVPKETKNKLREELGKLGIHESNIFPDLEHLAKEISFTEYKQNPKENITPRYLKLNTDDSYRDAEPST